MASPAERSGRQVSRAIDALRRGQPVVIRDGKAAVTVLAVELAEDDTLAALDAAAPADVLITASRAATLKLVNQRAAASGPVRIGRVPWLDLAAAVGLGDPVFDLTRPLKGPFAARDVGAAAAADAAIQLDKLAELLPALFIREAVKDDRQERPVTTGGGASSDLPDRPAHHTSATMQIAPTTQQQ